MESPGEVAKWSKIFCMGAFLVAVLSFFPFLLFYNTVDETGFAAHPISLIVSGVLLFGSVGAGVVSFVVHLMARSGSEVWPLRATRHAPTAAGETVPPIQPVSGIPTFKVVIAILLWMLASVLLVGVGTIVYAVLSD